MKECRPYSYSLAEDGIVYNTEDQKKVKTLVYLVDIDNSKKPPEFTLGGRFYDYVGVTGNTLKNKNISGIFANEGEVIQDKTRIVNGHINRNLRVIMGLLQATQPVVELLGYAEGGKQTNDGTLPSPSSELTLYWRVIGCAQRINGLGYKVNDDKKYRYNTSLKNQLLCFWEGDQHDKDRLSAMIITKVPRNAVNVTL